MECWEEDDQPGWAGYSFMNKQKTIKQKQKRWNKEVHGNVDLERTELERRIHSLERSDAWSSFFSRKGKITGLLWSI